MLGESQKTLLFLETYSVQAARSEKLHFLKREYTWGATRTTHWKQLKLNLFVPKKTIGSSNANFSFYV